MITVTKQSKLLIGNSIYKQKSEKNREKQSKVLLLIKNRGLKFCFKAILLLLGYLI